MKRSWIALALAAAGALAADSPWTARFLASRPAKGAEAPPAAAGDSAYLGITVWRFEASAHDREKPLPLVWQADGSIAPSLRQDGWTPERFPVSARTVAGQKFVLALETSRAGYFYVFQHNPPRMLASSSSAVAPGRIFTVPAQQAKVPYLVVERTDPSFAVLFSAKPLGEVASAANPSEAQVREWTAKWGAALAGQPSGGHGGAVSAAELLAAGHAWTLSPGDPPPLTIYHCDSCAPAAGAPLWFEIGLPVAR